MNIQVHIERLVLEGIDLDAADGPALQAAIQQELGDLLASWTTPGNLGESAVYSGKSAGPVHLERNQTPASLGKQIAQAVFASLTG